MVLALPLHRRVAASLTEARPTFRKTFSNCKFSSDGIIRRCTFYSIFYATLCQTVSVTGSVETWVEEDVLVPDVVVGGRLRASAKGDGCTA